MLLQGRLDLTAMTQALPACVPGPNIDWTALDAAYSALLQGGPGSNA